MPCRLTSSLISAIFRADPRQVLFIIPFYNEIKLGAVVFLALGGAKVRLHAHLQSTSAPPPRTPGCNHVRLHTVHASSHGPLPAQLVYKMLRPILLKHQVDA